MEPHTLGPAILSLWNVLSLEVQKCMLEQFFLFLYIYLQSVAVPLQGFLNAIVYGRTRIDFVRMMSSTRIFYVKTEDGSSELHMTHNSMESDEETLKNGERKVFFHSESLSTNPSDSESWCFYMTLCMYFVTVEWIAILFFYSVSSQCNTLFS